jgi:hypothetical protein
MSLFDEGTVIIVGAGASVPFGLPTGVELIDLIVKAFRAEAIKLKQQDRGSLANYKKLAPIAYAIWCNNNFNQSIRSGIGKHELEKLANWLHLQTGDTIDDIIRHNPDQATALKVGICYSLFKKSYLLGEDSSEDEIYKIRPFSDRKMPTTERQRNWIHHLINLARAEILDPEIANEGKKIRIISFNYDGILEHVLDAKWRDDGDKLGHWTDHFDIVHPHGKMEMPSTIRPDELPQYLFENANRIAVVHDKPDNPNSETAKIRSMACQYCKRALEVYAIGFAFARANYELIGLHCGVEIDRVEEDLPIYDPPIVRRYHYINYNDSSDLRERVGRLCARASSGGPDRDYCRVEPEETIVGTGDKQSISDALIAGFLGEMPS